MPDRDVSPLIDELSRCFKAIQLLSGRHIRSLGLTPPQFEVITVLGKAGSMHCGALGDATLITKGTLTGVLDRLEQKGWIQRETAPSDRRSVLVTLTHAGQALYEQLSRGPQANFHMVLDSLDETFTQNLSASLLKLRQALEAHDPLTKNGRKPATVSRHEFM